MSEDDDDCDDLSISFSSYSSSFSSLSFYARVSLAQKLSEKVFLLKMSCRQQGLTPSWEERPRINVDVLSTQNSVCVFQILHLFYLKKWGESERKSKKCWRERITFFDFLFATMGKSVSFEVESKFLEWFCTTHISFTLPLSWKNVTTCQHEVNVRGKVEEKK